jgi:outer membrane receptor for ferrienterochelin and colicins
MKTLASIILAFGLIGLVAADAAAQNPRPDDVGSMSIEDLLKVDVVSIASKFPQEVREAPASTTVITAQDIRRYGHRTLSDVLRSVRGFYTTYDRNYAYIGIRGFARPGDYNTRVLLLIDGWRSNDAVYDMAMIGSDFPMDVSLIERVEVIRGPASSLYGTSALFAVINVVTKTGGQLSGVRAELEGGSLGTRGATVSYGRLFAGGTELLLASTVRHSDGASSLHYPEFETGEPGSGIAHGLDADDAAHVFASAKTGRFSFRAGAATRRKKVPTASFATVFGDERFETTDDRVYASAVFDGAIGRGWLSTAQVTYDIYHYDGDYPYDMGAPTPTLLTDHALSQEAAAELTVRRRFGPRHLVTAGTDLRWQFQNEQSAAYEGEQNHIDIDEPSTAVAFYAQDEVRITPWLLANAGLRLDHYESFGVHVTPRAALVVLPRQQTAVKLLHGRAFRAPNPYELFYYAETQTRFASLEPEQIQSTELVWEEYLSNRVRTTLTAFTYRVENLVEQRSVTPGGDDLYFVNAGRVEGSGVEAELETRLPGGVNATASHSFTRVRDMETRAAFSNSPRHLFKASVQVPFAGFYVGVEGQYTGERMSVRGTPIAGAFVPNVTLTSPAGRRVAFSASVFNASNRIYSDPGAEEHLQESIAQDGRTALVRVRVKF